VWLGLSAVAARAAEEGTQPYVVLVGIDKYNDEQILPRKHAEADAKALYDLFVSKDYLGSMPSTSSCSWARRTGSAQRAGHA